MARVSAYELEKEMVTGDDSYVTNRSQRERSNFRLPQPGETVLIRHETKRGEIVPRQAIQHTSVITAVYKDKKVKVISGDIWSVEPNGNSTAEWRTIPDYE